MAGIIFPADAVSGSPSYTGRNLRDVLSVLLPGASSGRALGSQSGVRPGTPTNLVTATTTTWTVGRHSGAIDAEAGVNAGPYFYAFAFAETGSMNAADATNPRIDLLSVQISDPAESDGSAAPSAAIVYTVGTPAPTPAVPATPARSLALAQVNVPASGGGAPTVTFVAPELSWAMAELLARTTTVSVPSGGSFTAVGSGYVAPPRFQVGGVTDAAGVLTVPHAGLYLVAASVSWPSVAAASAWKRVLQVTVNGASAPYGNLRVTQWIPASVTTGTDFSSLADLVTLAAGDALQMRLYQNSGGTLSVSPQTFGVVRVA